MSMPRTYAAQRLLEHGALTFPQFVEITGWTQKSARWVMEKLLDQGLVNRIGTQGSYSKLPVYALASSNTAPGSQRLTASTRNTSLVDTTCVCRGLN